MKRSYQEHIEEENTTTETNNDQLESVVRSLYYNDINTSTEICWKRKCNCNPYSSFVRAGPFILGNRLNEVTQFSDIDHFIARKIDDFDPNRYYILKIAILPKEKQNESSAQRQAKFLIYNEYSVLSLLKNHPGVIQVQGLYLEYFYKKNENHKEISNEDEKCQKCLDYINNHVLFETHETLRENNDNDMQSDDDIDHHYLNCKYLNKNGTFMKRLILALDCHTSHMFSPVTLPFVHLSSKLLRSNFEYENLQEYVKRFKNVPEAKALDIFSKVVEIIFELHKKNIVHRDLRLENILYNRRNGRILIINFALARYVINDRILINDHRGSSAYISPDVLKRRPYTPKSSDCWALGVILFTMLFGKFPFYADNFTDLFRKINAANFRFPPYSVQTSLCTKDIIRQLIVTDAEKRLDIINLRKRLKHIMSSKFQNDLKAEGVSLLEEKRCIDEEIQVVPDMDNPIHQNAMLKHNLKLFFDKKFKFDRKSEIYINLNKEVWEAIKILRSKVGSEETTQLKDNCTFISVIYDMIERKNNINRMDKHLHDHNYIQSDLDKPFEVYLKERLFLVPNQSTKMDRYISSRISATNFLPVPYFTLKRRFCCNDTESIYKPKFLSNRSSIFFEEIDKHYNLESFIEDMITSLIKEQKERNSSVFGLLDGDSDIKSLIESLYDLLNQIRSSSYNSNT